MNIIEFIGDDILRHTIDEVSNILRLHNTDTGEYEEYLVQDCIGCDLCCLWENGRTPSQAGSCRFRTSPCVFFGYRTLKKIDTIMEDL